MKRLFFIFNAFLAGVFTASPVCASLGSYDRDGKILTPRYENGSEVNWKLLTEMEGGPIRAVGWLGQRCTGTLIDSGGGNGGTVYLLTAAHCANIKNPGQTVGGVELFDVFELNRFSDHRRVLQDQILVFNLTYASHDGVDLALYETALTRGEAKKRGIPLMRISTASLQPGDRVRMFGIPLAGVSQDQRFLHEAPCEIKTLLEKAAETPRGERVVWSRLLGTDCSGSGGISGSPLIDRNDQSIVGVVTETFDVDEVVKALNLNGLGESDLVGVLGHLGLTTNASPVNQLPGCFNSKGRFSLSMPQCHLPRGESSPEKLQIRCESGDGSACHSMVLMDQHGVVPMTAIHLLKKGCDFGDQRSCAAAGYSMTATMDPSLQVQGRALLRMACMGGIPMACYGAAMEAPNEKNALGLMKRSCDGGFFAACEVMLNWAPALQNQETWLDAAVPLCFLYSGRASDEACLALAQRYSEGKNKKPSLCRATLEAGCKNAPGGKSCEELSKTSEVQ